MRYIAPAASLLLATVVLADYYIDNGDPSVIYSMLPSESGQAWQTFSVDTQALDLKISNSTGNYTILLDASRCYDQNYALGVCGTGDGCFIEIPFTGSGITMYVFNAGFSGMAASFSVDGGTAVSNSIDAPPAPTYQVSNVSLYDVQGLPTGNHTIRMALLYWTGENDTSMKFDYAYVNETFVVNSTTSSIMSASVSQKPSQIASSMSHNENTGCIVSAVLGGLALLVGLVTGFLYLRRHRATRQSLPTAEPAFEVSPFTEFSTPTIPPASFVAQRPFSHQHGESIMPLMRTAILRDALAAANHSPSWLDQVSQSCKSGQCPGSFQPLRRPPSQSEDFDIYAHSSTSHMADLSSLFSDSLITSQANLTVEQAGVINRLWQDNVPPEMIVRIVEGFLSSNLSAGRSFPDRSFVSIMPPPSYQTRFDG